MSSRYWTSGGVSDRASRKARAWVGLRTSAFSRMNPCTHARPVAIIVRLFAQSSLPPRFDVVARVLTRAFSYGTSAFGNVLAYNSQ